MNFQPNIKRTMQFPYGLTIGSMFVDPPVKPEEDYRRLVINELNGGYI